VIASFSSKHRSRAESRASEAKALGGALAACEVAKLLDGLPPIPHRTAFSHGDLHGDNVHVRMGQAILIDFLNVGTKPIVHDPAALETALALNFGGELQVWRDVMANLYSLENPTALPPLSPPLTPLTHMWNAVRQVRRFGLADEISPCEYARAVAVHLLRHALRKPRANATAERRATMVLLAEKLAKELGAIDNAVKTPRAA
jgi:hypothetical protein